MLLETSAFGLFDAPALLLGFRLLRAVGLHDLLDLLVFAFKLGFEAANPLERFFREVRLISWRDRCRRLHLHYGRGVVHDLDDLVRFFGNPDHRLQWRGLGVYGGSRSSGLIALFFQSSSIPWLQG